MSTTTDRPMTVRQARAIVGNTRGRLPDQVNQAEALIRDLQMRNPGNHPDGGKSGTSCKSCGCQIWSLHSDGDDERWACERCHREPMSDGDAAKLRNAKAVKAEQAADEETARLAALPSPRAALATVLSELAEARGQHARVEAAGAASRDRVAALRAALGMAEEQLAIARTMVADAAVQALLDPSPTSRKLKMSVPAEAAAVVVAQEALETAIEAGRTIEEKLSDASYWVQRLEERAKGAALEVLRDELSPLYVARANTARNEFVAALKGLRWLVDADRSAPQSLIVQEVLWCSRNSPQSWKSTEPGPDLDTALAKLLAGDTRAGDLTL